MWGVRLREDAEILGPEPHSRVVSADWDLRELGCSDVRHSTATLSEVLGAGSIDSSSYTAAIVIKVPKFRKRERGEAAVTKLGN